jgi:hypothetical protein
VIEYWIVGFEDGSFVHAVRLRPSAPRSARRAIFAPERLVDYTLLKEAQTELGVQ